MPNSWTKILSVKVAGMTFFTVDSFVSCKQATNEHNFIKIKDERHLLNNYPRIYE